MKINENRPVGALQRSKKKSRTSGANGVFSLDGVEAGSASEPTAQTRSMMPVSNISSLLAVQESLDAPKRAGAINRGFATLDALDELKIDVLSGNLSRQKLVHLATLVERERVNIVDPALANLLDHIELRARVELAKYEQNNR